jgi:prepilin-type N-terminal cleavage/methylation domain-containing protein
VTARRRDAGLTLLEILFASTLLAVLFAYVYALVAGTLEIRNTIEQLATPYAVGPAVMDRISEDLRCSVLDGTIGFDSFKAERVTEFGEDATKLDFVADVPSRARVKVEGAYVKARVNELGYRVRRSETAQGLLALYRREDLGVDEEPLEGGVYYKLADRVKSFRLDFFADGDGDPESADDGKGEEEWDGKTKKKLPWAARVTLVLVGRPVVDDEGHAVEEVEEYPFTTFVVFPTWHDKKDK